MTVPNDHGTQRPRYTAAALARAAGLAHPPTPEQVSVIEAPLRPMLVVAGAGSGKTETMAGRVVWLVANGFVAPEHILGLTFTRKAAAELAERVGLRLRKLGEAGAPSLDRRCARSAHASRRTHGFDLPRVCRSAGLRARLASRDRARHSAADRSRRLAIRR
ncbi:MAG: UvrD-helicase domain-containing protein [Dermatophilaceae bacterium]